jgi:phosphoribosylformylglycinamidine synthase subunit PurL
VRILFQGDVAAEIPALALSENTPIYHRELLPEPPVYAQKAWAWSEDSLPTAAIRDGQHHRAKPPGLPFSISFWASPRSPLKQWVYRQYDHQVQNNTVQCPGQGDAAVIRLRPLESCPVISPVAWCEG